MEAQNYELETVAGGTLVFEPVTEYRETLGRATQIGRRLVGVVGVNDWDAIRSELARRGHGAGLVHQLEEFDGMEVRR
ncbi:hypothetical protein CYV19_09820 [Natronobacterium gregoryi SP2]|uniref:Uncharacterized protein n=1 Tax=Natronobacterium gregoryi (strain ATCC 43098 / DSM 3393 / CCM 3738 / CIP 104747 / IAM 13177 / JCM 8860 / NBRC 102187 / NCIMB 2189 / SP2) TaxID=797304 RepID=L9Y9V1_NATGS|nr:hypothetical protein C490_06077 [Natronobacterium gregoryi SP2]PLK20415.1 hypothetical protein CYV19_09820 [Natronobacterium gregoryi SP2]